LAANGVLVNDICSFISMFQFVTFSVVKYACNKVASALEDCCGFITSSVSSDMNQKTLIISFKKIIIKIAPLKIVALDSKTYRISPNCK
jgi:hypothetical protein